MGTEAGVLVVLAGGRRMVGVLDAQLPAQAGAQPRQLVRRLRGVDRARRRGPAYQPRRHVAKGQGRAQRSRFVLLPAFSSPYRRPSLPAARTGNTTGGSSRSASQPRRCLGRVRPRRCVWLELEAERVLQEWPKREHLDLVCMSI